MPLQPGTRLGPYEITAQIGVGGMGEVYRATDTKLKRDVAVKVLPESLATDPERLARFQREAEVLASLNHPNIAAIYGLEDSADTKALVMELVDGPTLADRISQGAIPVDEALPIAKQIAEAFEAAHEQGIIHRDLKPANVKVRPDGTVKVLDFGLAKAMEPTGAMSPSMSQSPTITTPAMTQAGMILGTAAYMSPEQAKGRPIDRRSDLWPLGCVLFEMLSGVRAFEGEDIADTLGNVLKVEPNWDTLPSTIPPRIRQATRACLQKNPKQRLDSAQGLRLALEGAFESPAASVASDVAVSRGMWTGLPVVAGVLLLGALAGGAVAWSMRPGVPPGEPARLSLLLPAEAPVFFGGTPRSTLALSPDGSLVVYSALARDLRPLFNLRVRSLASLETRVLPGTEGGTQPFFSPDGRWVAFVTGEGELKKVALAGGAPITLFDGLSGGVFTFGAWTDDDEIVFDRGDAAELGLQRASADGGTPAPLTTLDTTQGEASHLAPDVVRACQTITDFCVLGAAGWIV